MAERNGNKMKINVEFIQNMLKKSHRWEAVSWTIVIPLKFLAFYWRFVKSKDFTVWYTSLCLINLKLYNLCKRTNINLCTLGHNKLKYVHFIYYLHNWVYNIHFGISCILY